MLYSWLKKWKSQDQAICQYEKVARDSLNKQTYKIPLQIEAISFNSYIMPTISLLSRLQFLSKHISDSRIQVSNIFDVLRIYF